MRPPTLASEWTPLFIPVRTGHYVNDHTIIRGPDDQWHLFGITSRAFADVAETERYFVHAAGPSLRTGARLEERGKVIDDGNRAWAPAVVERDGIFYMLYGPSPTKLAVSERLGHWMGHPVTMKGTPPLSTHRDHMLLQLDDGRWLMYASGVKGGYGCISLHISHDLQVWDFAGYALTSGGNAPLQPEWGAFESPFVLRRDGIYYLFTTYTDGRRENYHDTLVFASDDPARFGHYTGDNHHELVMTRLHAHAPEIIDDGQGLLITSAGWRGRGTVVEGGVGIAELAF